MGGGPFPTELDGDLGNKLQEIGGEIVSYSSELPHAELRSNASREFQQAGEEDVAGLISWFSNTRLQ